MNGLVGFFDILGYQSFLENNSASDSALHVLQIINEVPQQAKKLVQSELGDQTTFFEIGKSLEHIVFSDTIVFTLPYPIQADDKWIYNAQGYITYCSSVLASKMFENGLPIRGVLHEGEFITQQHCLAGKAIVEAYQLCGKLDFASVVLTSYLTDKICAKQIDGAINNDSNYLFSYLSPMKNGCEEKLVHLNWLSQMQPNNIDQFEKEAENFVMKSFWDHKKDCSMLADQKVHNTVKVMRKMFQNYKLNTSKGVVANSKI